MHIPDIKVSDYNIKVLTIFETDYYYEYNKWTFTINGEKLDNSTIVIRKTIQLQLHNCNWKIITIIFGQRYNCNGTNAQL